ncbi:MAG: hypothetical protein QOE05_529 [Actinomycetota bacterium]|jgi:uncharacterized membrane protein YozB (DUF420 family)|nr:hypothetical protein [Actinomycetota bacterium]
MIRPMNRRGRLHRRPVLLAAAAATGVVTGHVLDALGLLPGVDEPMAVRAAALAPRYTVMTVLGAAALAAGAEWLLRRRRPWPAVVVLVAGQTALLALPEALAEAAGRTSGAGGSEAEEAAKLALAVGLQVVLAALAVAIAVVVDALLLRLPQRLEALAVPPLPRAPVALSTVPSGRIVGGVRGRGPPVPVIP